MSYAKIIAEQPDQQDIIWDGTFAKDPSRIVKIGIHRGKDATVRHSVEHFKNQYDRVQAGTAKVNEVFRGLPLKLGYKVSTLYSYNFETTREAKEFEEKLLAGFTPNVRISGQWNGYSECRYLTNQQILQYVNFLQSIYPPYNKQEEYEHKVYFQVLDKLPQVKEIPQFILEGGRFSQNKLPILADKAHLLKKWEDKKAALV